MTGISLIRYAYNAARVFISSVSKLTPIKGDNSGDIGSLFIHRPDYYSVIAHTSNFSPNIGIGNWSPGILWEKIYCGVRWSWALCQRSPPYGPPIAGAAGARWEEGSRRLVLRELSRPARSRAAIGSGLTSSLCFKEAVLLLLLWRVAPGRACWFWKLNFHLPSNRLKNQVFLVSFILECGTDSFMGCAVCIYVCQIIFRTVIAFSVNRNWCNYRIFFKSFSLVHLPICTFSALLFIPWGIVKEMQYCATEN